MVQGHAPPARHRHRLNFVTNHHPRRGFKPAAVKPTSFGKRIAVPRDVTLQPRLHHHLIAPHGIGTQRATAGRFKGPRKPGNHVAQIRCPFVGDTDRFGPVPNHSHIENRFTDDHACYRHAGKFRGRRIAGQKRQKDPNKAHKARLPRHG